MKILYIFLLLLPLNLLFAETITIQVRGDNDYHYSGQILAVPATVVCTVSPEFQGRAGIEGVFETFTTANLTITDSSHIGKRFYLKCSAYNPSMASCDATFEVTYSNPPPVDQHQTQYGHTLNACPKGCGVCLTCTPGHAVWNSSLERLVYGCETLPGGGGGDGTDAPWARESSLQSLISGFSTFGNTWAQWAQSLSGKVDTANQSLSGIQNQLTSINSQQINNQQTFASYMDSLFNAYLNPLKDKADTANGHLNDLNDKVDTANGHLNDLNGKADTANGHLTGLNQKAEITNQNVSDTRQFTEQIKNSLNPSNVTAPTMETPLDDITPNFTSLSTLKNKLLPRYSFFSNPGGSQFPEWSFTLPLQSLGWRDFTIVFGGAAWSTVGGGILLTLMQFIRTLSKFVFYFIFLRCIILYLRQW